MYGRNSGLKFFSRFLGLSPPILAKNNAGKRFFNFFDFFCYFFRNFLAQVEYEQNSGLKFFPLFLGLSHPVLARNNTRKRFFDFLNFFAIFFLNFLPRAQYERNLWLNFFLSLSAYLIPFWLKRIPERGALNFWIFLPFFSKFSCPVRVWTK